MKEVSVKETEKFNGKIITGLSVAKDGKGNPFSLNFMFHDGTMIRIDAETGNFLHLFHGRPDGDFFYENMENAI